MKTRVPIKFGTDGWRALMETDFTFENLERVAQAFADHLNARKKGSRVAVGYDTRLHSAEFAARVAEVLRGNGVEVVLASRPTPTPAVSYAVVSRKLDAGVAITASHNPPGYNGFKIKMDFGGSADRMVTDDVESRMDQTPVRRETLPASAKQDLVEPFLRNLSSYLKIDVVRQAPYKLLVDSMHGTGDHFVEKLLAGGKIQVQTIRGGADPTFGGTPPEPIAKYLGPSIEVMKRREHHLCMVTDGDADRVGALRPGGEFIPPGTILSLILLHFAQDLGRKGSVVTTISNTALIYRIAKKMGLTVHETPVGFKYVCEIMRRERVIIGGEESGGIGFQDYLYERDGILSGLLLLQMMATRKQTLEEILTSVEKEYGRLYYVRNDIEYANEKKPLLFKHLKENQPKAFAGHKIVRVNAVDGTKFVFEDDSWLLFRLSGTEPILRIYSEASSQSLAETFVREGIELARSI